MKQVYETASRFLSSSSLISALALGCAVETESDTLGDAESALDLSDSVMKFTECASEGGTCVVSGKVYAKFGAGTKFVYATVTGGFECNLATFGGTSVDPAPGVPKKCFYSDYYDEVPEGGEFANTRGSRNWAFGVNGRFIFKTLPAGRFKCGLETFDHQDPATGTKKFCYGALDAFLHNAKEGDGNSFTLASDGVVAYGGGGKFVLARKPAGKSITCNTSSFGGVDPAPNIPKDCYSRSSNDYATFKVLPVPHERQQRDMWCWVTVVKSLLDFYGYPSEEQCELVEQVRKESNWLRYWGQYKYNHANYGDKNCCVDPGVNHAAQPELNWDTEKLPNDTVPAQCNHGGGWQDWLLALRNLGYTAVSNSLDGRPAPKSASYLLTYDAIRQEIDAKRPIIAWIKSIQNGLCDPAVGGHAVLIIGYGDRTTGGADGDQNIVYMDPAAASITTGSYEDLVWNETGGSCWHLALKVDKTTQDRNTLATYSQSDFQSSDGGLSTGLFQDSVSYVGANANDKVESAQVRGNPFLMYEHANYSGAAWPVTAGNYATPDDWRGTSGVSSILRLPEPPVVRSTVTVTRAESPRTMVSRYSQQSYVLAFEHGNYQGRKMVFHNEARYQKILVDEAGKPFDNLISSLVVVGGDVVVAYSGSGLTGSQYALTSTGGPNHDGFYPNPESWGGTDNDIASLSFLSPRQTSVLLAYDGYEMTGRAVAIVRPKTNSEVLPSPVDLGISVTRSIRTPGSGCWSLCDSIGCEDVSPSSWRSHLQNQFTSVKYTASDEWVFGPSRCGSSQ